MAAKMTCAPLTSASVFRVLSARNARNVLITEQHLSSTTHYFIFYLRFTLVDVRKILIDEAVPAVPELLPPED